MTKPNFPPLSIVHGGSLPPEHFEVRTNHAVIIGRRLQNNDEKAIKTGIETSEPLLRAWLTWHDDDGNRDDWSRVASTIANEFITANWWANRLWFNWVLYNDTECIGMVDTGPKGNGTFEIGYWTT